MPTFKLTMTIELKVLFDELAGCKVYVFTSFPYHKGIILTEQDEGNVVGLNTISYDGLIRSGYSLLDEDANVYAKDKLRATLKGINEQSNRLMEL